jgi:predicted lipid-binding transport protein (Tim44 family)
MKKSMFAFMGTLFMGLLFMLLGHKIWGYSEIGIIVSISFMGAFVIYFNNK